jgi:U3 small nucleolar RNA-associated protein 3
MGKKRKARSAGLGSQPKELDLADARLGPITSYEDIADEQEDFYLKKDQILFEDEPISKRRRRADTEDEFLEESDAELYAEDAESSGEEKFEEQGRDPKRLGLGDDDEESAEDDEDDQGGWGSSRKGYFNADKLETEADALEEEAEAKRLQQKKLSKMTEADFMPDADEWFEPGAGKLDGQQVVTETLDGKQVVTEVLRDVEVTEDMGPEERYRILQSRYPEFDYLADELLELYPASLELRQQAHGKPNRSLEVVKHWVLGSYVACLAMYFAILTSPARDKGKAECISSEEIHNHEVMQMLVDCRAAWSKVKEYRHLTPKPDNLEAASSEKSAKLDAALSSDSRISTETRSEKKTKQKKTTQKPARNLEVEASLASLAESLARAKANSAIKTRPKNTTLTGGGHSGSGFGEDEALDARVAADKVAKKKSLRFYASQIDSTSKSRAMAGRIAGGDTDIPYKRKKDREARLQAEAERRGRSDSKFGADLGEGSEGDEREAENEVQLNDEDMKYYDELLTKSKKKKDDKLQQKEAAGMPGRRAAVSEEVGPDGKRKITYAIETNKGLTRKRKKELRNPRVKKRNKWEEKQKKLRSVKQVWKGGEGRGYQGETTGIKAGLIRSIKL